MTDRGGVLGGAGGSALDSLTRDPACIFWAQTFSLALGATGAGAGTCPFTGSGAGTRAFVSTGAGPRASLILPESERSPWSATVDCAAAPQTGHIGSRCADNDDDASDNSHW